ncbi:ATP-dependent RNA helicase Dbp10 [Schizosaccharomyces cryophilus OY26]|uniref:RNA helicase n=1 Tax=Schizosaccharomyces cryophilus (strain OY26 / ATCC MYA-4695 / CBS 11777 / NBRC 106824 / NRRL Y48691) TaxID=653667 RepID=S9X8K5_SCHCR|nr:ATP-dependent RNA helicase Dbp10 [Schizosaccharomyces cryophilus OY26]EPY53472.1 ATP-dependent RNA helicase Dbp10 [Schizosaccharomyces cryophilus OY26]
MSELQTVDEVDIAGSLAPLPLKPESDGFEAGIAETSIGSQNASKEPENEEDDEAFIASNILKSNRKTKGKKLAGKASNFQAMGLSQNVLRAILKKGFKVPTPIQRKTIPLVLEGRDVVGMARTGSGKTAAFVIPMIERLKSTLAQSGTRALILSPSRELALQTMRVVKDFNKGTDLRVAAIVGGVSLEEQFSIMTAKPDIIIATPGRFMHLKVEMKLELNAIEYVVFDEADRLFEMGFAAQLTEILHDLPSARQTLLFSATLPRTLVDFAKAGLQDPVLVRLDVESKISSDLQSAFFSVKTADREAALLYILQDVIKLSLKRDIKPVVSMDSENPKKRKRIMEAVNQGRFSGSSDATLVFVPTKHHVEYISNLLALAGYSVSTIYGSLDQDARTNQINKFRLGFSNVLVVTDVAARGIDIPLLANVVNYDFPPQPKVFVHRVGRTARAGRTGWAYTLVRSEDAGYFLDLQLFLNREIVTTNKKVKTADDCDFTKQLVLGGLPTASVSELSEWVQRVVAEDIEIEQLSKVAARGEKLYFRTRPSCSPESVKRAKELVNTSGWNLVNPLLSNSMDIEADSQFSALLAKVSSFRPSETIFEIGQRGHHRSEAGEIMRQRRSKIKPKGLQRTTIDNELLDDSEVSTKTNSEPELSETELENTFQTPQSLKEQQKASRDFRDKEYYMSHYAPKENIQENGYAVNSAENFTLAARHAVLDLSNDEGIHQTNRSGQRWDPKKKKFVNTINDEDGSRGVKLIRGESGVKLPATYRSGRFEAWKSNKAQGNNGSMPLNDNSGRQFKHKQVKAPKAADKYRTDYKVRKARVKEAKEKGIGVKISDELKSAPQIRKDRQLKEKRKAKTARPSKKRR